MSDAIDPTRLAAYPHLIEDRVRYGDTDRQGHVNNAVYATFFETGRTMMFAERLPTLVSATREPVLARLVIDFRREVHWPGMVTIGSGVLSVGTSSCAFAQAVFQGETCVASGEAVIVQLDSATRRSVPWSKEQRALLQAMQLN